MALISSNLGMPIYCGFIEEQTDYGSYYIWEVAIWKTPNHIFVYNKNNELYYYEYGSNVSFDLLEISTEVIIYPASELSVVTDCYCVEK